MYIKEKIKQNRRDFWAIYKCENCECETKEKQGYDDDFFHNTVIPKMKCEKCGKSSMELNTSPPRLTPLYDKNFVI